MNLECKERERESVADRESFVIRCACVICYVLSKRLATLTVIDHHLLQ